MVKLMEFVLSCLCNMYRNYPKSYGQDSEKNYIMYIMRQWRSFIYHIHNYLNLTLNCPSLISAYEMGFKDFDFKCKRGFSATKQSRFQVGVNFINTYEVGF